MRRRTVHRLVAVTGALAAIIGAAPSAGAAPQTSANLSVTLVDSPDPVAQGGEVTYTITVSNSGPGTASNASVRAQLWRGATFLRGTGPLGSCEGGSDWAFCDLGSIPKRGNVTAEIVFQAPEENFENTVYVNHSNTESKPEDNQATAATTVLPEAPMGLIDLCTHVAPVSCYGTPFWLEAETQVTLALHPAPGFTGVLTASVGDLSLGGQFIAGQLESGASEAQTTLAPGRYYQLTGKAPARTHSVHPGGPVTIRVPIVGCIPTWGPNPWCPPSHTVDTPPVNPSVPSVGAYVVTLTASG